ncbi:MAG: sensor histidine kinase, partial [Terriglobales bacterium]
PHFLFNTLNGISTLVGEGDAPGARRMIALLGDFLRATLERSGDAEISLDQEIELVRRYLAIEQVRLGERLQVLWRIAPEAARIRVPSLILQPLIENAIRHGITPSPAPGWIEVVGNVRGGTLAIEVANSRGTNFSARSSGLGLRHTRDRLEAHYGGQAGCDIHDRDSDRWRVRLNIPVVPAAAEAACAS